MAPPGTFETCRRTLRMSVYRAGLAQGHYRDAGRRHVIVRHEEVRRQRDRGIDAIAVEITHSAGIEQLVIDTELPGELARRLCEDDISRISHDLGRAARAHHGIAPQEIADRGGSDRSARPKPVDLDARTLQLGR